MPRVIPEEWAEAASGSRQGKESQAYHEQPVYLLQ